MKASGVGIADVVQATVALRPNAAGAEAIVRMCGMELTTKVEDVVPPDADKPEDYGFETDNTSAPNVGEAKVQSLPPSVQKLKPVRQDTRAAASRDPIGARTPTVQRPAPDFEGLLTERDGIELMRLAASISSATDRVDVDRVVQHLAYAKPLTELPRLQVKSLAFGTQILVDVGLSMQQFYDDQQDVVKRVADKLRNFADIQYFADDPMRGCGPERRRFTWSDYRLPRPQVPVIALTDLGCGYPRRVEAIRAWIHLAEHLRRRQSRVVVFAAVTLERIPDGLARAVDLVSWDRSAVRRNVMQLAGVRDE
jgi:hypothetical protein